MPLTRLAGPGATPSASVGALIRDVSLPLLASITRPLVLGLTSTFPGVCARFYCCLVVLQLQALAWLGGGGGVFDFFFAVACPEFDFGAKLSARVRMFDVCDGYCYMF